MNALLEMENKVLRMYLNHGRPMVTWDRRTASLRSPENQSRKITYNVLVLLYIFTILIINNNNNATRKEVFFCKFNYITDDRRERNVTQQYSSSFSFAFILCKYHRDYF